MHHFHISRKRLFLPVDAHNDNYLLLLGIAGSHHAADTGTRDNLSCDIASLLGSLLSQSTGETFAGNGVVAGWWDCLSLCDSVLTAGLTGGSIQKGSG